MFLTNRYIDSPGCVGSTPKPVTSLAATTPVARIMASARRSAAGTPARVLVELPKLTIYFRDKTRMAGTMAVFRRSGPW